MIHVAESKAGLILAHKRPVAEEPTNPRQCRNLPVIQQVCFDRVDDDQTRLDYFFSRLQWPATVFRQERAGWLLQLQDSPLHIEQSGM